MHKAHQIKVVGLKPSLFVCLMILAGFIVGGGLYLLSAIAAPSYSLYVPLGEWEQLAVVPPSNTVQLMAYQRGRIFLKSLDGKLHSCNVSARACSHVQYVPDTALRLCGEPGSLTPFTPGRIISSFSVRDCYPDVYVDTHFILVENGSIWKWQRWWSQNDVHLMLIGSAIYGALTGAVASTIVLWRRRNRTPHFGSALTHRNAAGGQAPPL